MQSKMLKEILDEGAIEQSLADLRTFILSRSTFAGSGQYA